MVVTGSPFCLFLSVPLLHYFLHIADGVGEITDHHYGEGFYDHPSIKVIQANIGTKGEEDCLSFQLTNATQIEDLLSNVNTRKACGHDMLPPRLIKESSRAIAGPVAKILNTSIAHSRYPSRWKMGQVTPLFKRDEELDKQNYRPVTVLPCLNNIFERLLSVQIEDFYQGYCRTSFQLIGKVTVVRPRFSNLRKTGAHAVIVRN